MIPIVSFVGRSNVGKTTYLVKLIKEIKKRHYRVATIKHHHGSFEIDHRGKDTWHHAQAGADVVIISSPNKLAVIEKLPEERPLDKIIQNIKDVDLIITEGYKKEDKPKIEILRGAVGQELVCQPEELLAVVTDVELDVTLPCFGLDEVEEMVDFLEKKILLPAKNFGKRQE